MTRDEYGTAFEKNYKRTILTLRRRGLDFMRSEELAQAAWVCGWVRLRQLRDPRRVVGWINTIAFNKLRDEVRRCQRQSPFGPEQDQSILPQANVIAIDINRTLQRCAPCQRDLLRDVYLAGYSASEVADGLGVSLGAAQHRISRALQAARKRIATG